VLIKDRAELVGVPYDFRPVVGGDHGLSDHMDEIIQWSSDFLFKHVIQGVPTRAAETRNGRPAAFQLLQNYPNPVSVSQAQALNREVFTHIRFTLAHGGKVTLKVFDTLGREIQTLALGNYAPGAYTKKFTATGLPAGLYFYRLQVGETVSVRKMILAH
jgi:hypothetical protein